MAAQVEEQGKKRKSKLWFLLAVAFIALAAGIYFYFSTGSGRLDGEVPAKDMHTLTFTEITVNLADQGSNRYLKTSITLDYADKDLEEELTAAKYKVKDAILKVLRDTSSSSLDTPEETELLKHKLLEAVNLQLKTGQVTGLYFEDFIVQ